MDYVVLDFTSDTRSTPEGEAAYLCALGSRLRTARARRGVSRQALARGSGVSERYIAQAEAGTANLSVLLLRRIARALGVPAAELVADRNVPPEMALLDETLSKLSPTRLAEVRTELARRFGGTSPLDRARRLALIGLRGAGKTTLGKALAEIWGVRFVELAREAEQEAGMSLADLFETAGQTGFRQYERRALERALSRSGPAVLAVGGGIVAEPATYARLLESCTTIWLRATPEEHMRRVVAQGDSRPMAGSKQAMEELRAILSSREPLYARADHVVDTSGRSLQETLDLLTTFLPFEPAKAE